MESPRRALRHLDRHVLAREREVGRLRRGLRLLRAVALRRGGHAAARDDGAGADPRARTRGRGGRRPPLLHGHTGPGALEARLREGARRHAARRRAHEPEALRLDRPHVARARAGAQGGRRPARAPQRRDGRVLLPGGLLDRPLRGPTAHDRRRQGGRAGDVRRRDPQPRRVARAARRDGVPAVGDRPDERADQPAQPAPRHEVRRPRLHGPVGGGQVDRDLPPDPSRGAVPPLRRPRREHRRPAAACRPRRHQRRDDGQLPHHPRQHARGGPRDVRGAGPQRRAPARQRRQPASGQPLRLAGGRDARRRRDAPRQRPRAERRHRDQTVGSGDAAALREQARDPAASRTGRPTPARDDPTREAAARR